MLQRCAIIFTPKSLSYLNPTIKSIYTSVKTLNLMSDLVRGSRVLLLLLSMSRFSNNEHLLLVLFKFSHLSFIIITINYLQTFKVNIFSTKVEMPLKKDKSDPDYRS